MGKRFYVVTRDLHLYVGLFLSPFVLVFAISVFYLVHSRVGREAAPPGRVVSNLPVTDELERLSGRDQVNSVRPLLDRLGVRGEVSFIRRIPKEHRLVIPVLVPGRETTVELDLQSRTATISERSTGVSNALIHLHKMPGPHNVNIRVNSSYMRIWRWLADVTTYGLLFLTFSGVYLWAVLRAERRVGIGLLSAGAISFCGIVYAVSH
ncbi:MAG: PepSY-associated TM helix domain-containing protein [Acidobacteria bacterium]|nr:PepSY-associated TM helix domain-containing protein [Acidobacteriota bacterium]